MYFSVVTALSLLSGLVPLALAVTTQLLPGANPTSNSIATVTTVFPTTVTNIITTTAAQITTTTACTIGSTAPSSWQCTDYAWSSAGKYWREDCGGVSISGAVTRPPLGVYARQANINNCYLYCNIFAGLCNAVNYVPASSSCAYLWDDGSASTVSAQGFQAIKPYATDPCTETITKTETGVEIQYLTTDITSVYFVTVTSTSTAAATTTSSSESSIIVAPTSTPSSPPVDSSASSASSSTPVVVPPRSSPSSSPISSTILPSSSLIPASSISTTTPTSISVSPSLAPVPTSSQPLVSTTSVTTVPTTSTPVEETTSHILIPTPIQSSTPAQSSSIIATSMTSAISSPVLSPVSIPSTTFSTRPARPTACRNKHKYSSPDSIPEESIQPV
ncbi:uncharacterized protein BDV14DRAFT_170598 [Aspergillus stella-maris]|uniref:uncharacterized protein n=1 Tax=Aspergillus stella-maris TaxID=1810926 RepID=UPI003CCD2682